MARSIKSIRQNVWIVMRSLLDIGLCCFQSRNAVFSGLMAGVRDLGWIRLGCTLLFWAFLSSSSWAETRVSGAISANTVWTKEHSPYIVTANVVIQNWVKLTINPGVTIYMTEGSSLIVYQGSLEARGTLQEPIRVLSEKIYRGLEGQAGDWGRLVFEPGSYNGLLEHVILEHGSGVVVRDSYYHTFNYLAVRNHKGAAISTEGAASIKGVGNQASGNEINGVLVQAGDFKSEVAWGLRGIPYVIASGTVGIGTPPEVTSITPETLQPGETLQFTLYGSRLNGFSSVSFDKTGLSANILSGGTDKQAMLEVTAEASVSTGPSMLQFMTDAGGVQVKNALSVVSPQPRLIGLDPSVLYIEQGPVELKVQGHRFDSQSIAMVNGESVPTRIEAASTTQLTATVHAPSVPGTLSVHLRTPDPLVAGQYLNSNELLLPVLQTQLSVHPISASLTKGAVKSFTVKLPYAAPVGGIALNLASSVPGVATVPSAVIVPEGQSSTSFEVSAVDLGTTVLSISRAGFLSAQAEVSVALPPQLTFVPSSLALSAQRNSILTLKSSIPVEAADLNITLVSSDSTVATVPQSVTIPVGQNSASVALTTINEGNAAITAQAVGFVGGSATVAVGPFSLKLPAGALVAPGLNRSIPINLSEPAPQGGLTVTLSSNNPTVASVAPASVVIPAGQTSASFMLTGGTIGTAAISATATDYLGATLPVTVDSLTVGWGRPAKSTISVPVGFSETQVITLSRPAPLGGVQVDLAVSDGTKAAISPTSVTIAEGQTSSGTVPVSVTGVDAGSATLSISAAGLNPVNVAVAVTQKPVLEFSISYPYSSTTGVVVGNGMKTNVSETYPVIRITRRIGFQSYAPGTPLNVMLTSSDASKVSVPAMVTIPAYSSSVHFAVTGMNLTEADGAPVTIDAAAAGYIAPVTKLPVKVINPTLVFGPYTYSDRHGIGERKYLSIRLRVLPENSHPAAPVAVRDLPISVSIVDALPEQNIAGFYDAPTGGNEVTQVVIPAGSREKGVYIGAPTSPGSYRVKAQMMGGAPWVTPLTKIQSGQLNFRSQFDVVGKGMASNVQDAQVWLSQGDGSSTLYNEKPVTVTLTSSDPAKVSFPSTVTIPAGQAYAYFSVTGLELTNAPVTIEAKAEGYAASVGGMSVSVVNPTIEIHSLDGNRSTNSGRDNFYITLSNPAYRGWRETTAAVDLPVQLSVVQASSEGVVSGFYEQESGGEAIAQAVIKAGTAGTDDVYLGVPTTSGSYKVKAEIAGIGSIESAVQQVNDALAGLRFQPSNLTVGKGLNSAQDEVQVCRLLSGSGYLYGTNAVVVNLVSEDTVKVTVPETVTIPAGSACTSITVTGKGLTNNALVSVSATATGYTSPTSSLSVDVVQPILTFDGLENFRGIGGERDGFSVQIMRDNNYYYFPQKAAVDIPVQLSVVDALMAGAPLEIYDASSVGNVILQGIIPAGESKMKIGLGDLAYVSTPTASGSYKIKAETTDGSTALSAEQKVEIPDLQISAGSCYGCRTSMVVGKGMKTYLKQVYVFRSINDISIAGAEAVTVNLSCSSTAICRVPASVTIPAGESSAYFQVEGVELGSALLRASGAGFNAPAEIEVSVVTPVLEYYQYTMPADVHVGGTAEFSVRLRTPGNWSGDQEVTNPISVNLTSSAPAVATLQSSTVTIQPGGYLSDTARLMGVAPGTTQVTASGPGVSSATSRVVTINP